MLAAESHFHDFFRCTRCASFCTAVKTIILHRSQESKLQISAKFHKTASPFSRMNAAGANLLQSSSNISPILINFSEWQHFSKKLSRSPLIFKLKDFCRNSKDCFKDTLKARNLIYESSKRVHQKFARNLKKSSQIL